LNLSLFGIGDVTVIRAAVPKTLAEHSEELSHTPEIESLHPRAEPLDSLLPDETRGSLRPTLTP